MPTGTGLVRYPDFQVAYEVVACIDGRGFRQRRADMRDLLLILNGKVFTAATLDRLIDSTRICEFVSREI
jgi:hypothetical protein